MTVMVVVELPIEGVQVKSCEGRVWQSKRRRSKELKFWDTHSPENDPNRPTIPDPNLKPDVVHAEWSVLI